MVIIKILNLVFIKLKHSIRSTVNTISPIYIHSFLIYLSGYCMNTYLSTVFSVRYNVCVLSTIMCLICIYYCVQEGHKAMTVMKDGVLKHCIMSSDTSIATFILSQVIVVTMCGTFYSLLFKSIVYVLDYTYPVNGTMHWLLLLHLICVSTAATLTGMLCAVLRLNTATVRFLLSSFSIFFCAFSGGIISPIAIYNSLPYCVYVLLYPLRCIQKVALYALSNNQIAYQHSDITEKADLYTTLLHTYMPSANTIILTYVIAALYVMSLYYTVCIYFNKNLDE